MKNRILQFVDHLLHPLNLDDPQQVIKEATRLLEHDKNYYGALDLLKPLANNGDPLAQTIVGGIFRELTTLPDNFAEAIRWFKMAADQGFPLAQLNLGIMHLDGLGCPRSPMEAASWFQRAAEHGQALAQFELASLILHGELGQPNLETALFWLNKAMDQQFAPAINELARMYETGHGVPLNPQKALQLRRDAAAGGDYESRLALGKLLYQQADQTNDQALFMLRLEESAQYGNVDAQARLGQSSTAVWAFRRTGKKLLPTGLWLQSKGTRNLGTISNNSSTMTLNQRPWKTQCPTSRELARTRPGMLI